MMRHEYKDLVSKQLLKALDNLDFAFKYGKEFNKSKKVRFTKDDEILEFEKASDAAKYFGVTPPVISKALHSKFKNFRGYKMERM